MFDYDSSSTDSRWITEPGFDCPPPRKHLWPKSNATVDVSVVPGERATVDVIQNAALRKRLIELIRRFQNEDALSVSSSDAAEVFIEALPRNAPLPKISPDADGALLMVWVRDNDKTLVAIENWAIHAVAHAGTPLAEYYEDIEFEGGNIPQDILNIVAAA